MWYESRFFAGDEWRVDSARDLYFVLFPSWIYLLCDSGERKHTRCSVDHCTDAPSLYFFLIERAGFLV